MKKSKGFKVGDKVFAKVKGYPAWPAIITEDKNNRYNVKFYGTGETGTVKPKDLFYYLKHKNSFVKSHKRKDYNDAIEEIEKAIQEAGTDGNEEEQTEPNSTATPNNSDTNSAKPVKRKRSASVSTEKVNEAQVKKRARSRTPHPVDIVSETAEENEKKEENGNTKMESYNDENKPIQEEEKPKNINIKEESTVNSNSKTIQNDKDYETVSVEETMQEEQDEALEENRKVSDSYNISDVYVITTEFLQGLIAYAEYVRQKEEIYKKMPVENRNKDKLELFIVKQPDGKLVGIKFNYETQPTLDNEYEYAQYEEVKAKKLLSYKTLLEQGSSEDEPHMFVRNLNFNMDDVTNAIEMDVIKRKREKVVWLKTETNLIELDVNIKGNLGLDKAEPKEALEHLDKMLRLNIEPLMLKKHPPVVDMIKRLCRYIGNVKEWDMTDDELEVFEIDAARVRNKAADVYLMFSSVFDVEDETKFWDIFTEQVETFKEQIKDMSESYVYALTAEPYSRKAFFDAMDEAEEMKLILSKLEKNSKSNKIQQDNKTANSENNENQADVVDNSDPIS